MKRSRRSYTMDRRAASIAGTRERIVGAAAGLFLARWYDEVSVQDVADAAGVALSTVVRHFPTKGLLFMAASVNDVPDAAETVDDTPPGDVVEAVARLVERYEKVGGVMMRAFALQEREPEIRPAIANARFMLRTWIERVYAPLLPAVRVEREPIVDELAVLYDASTWNLWRRVLERSVEETVAHLVRMTHAALGC